MLLDFQTDLKGLGSAYLREALLSGSTVFAIIQAASIKGNAVMHLSILTPRERGGGGELDNFEKSLTNSPPIGKNFVSKIPWMGHQICYII